MSVAPPPFQRVSHSPVQSFWAWAVVAQRRASSAAVRRAGHRKTDPLVEGDRAMEEPRAALARIDDAASRNYWRVLCVAMAAAWEGEAPFEPGGSRREPENPPHPNPLPRA